ncbi:hypothetical protein [Vibrio phage BUCT194]|uniref:Uncharacterized protein n=1 Tax=Vibrio phage BUCT194 TaxID=2859072 RepID=A0AAE8XJA0_9CAUD|nr:hypothetical protein PP741_gp055 [Vibrio phage BUCT194]UAW01170.1 hypothetical protein [Vibrio phage BUCT194]
MRLIRVLKHSETPDWVRLIKYRDTMYRTDTHLHKVMVHHKIFSGFEPMANGEVIVRKIFKGGF